MILTFFYDENHAAASWKVSDGFWGLSMRGYIIKDSYNALPGWVVFYLLKLMKSDPARIEIIECRGKSLISFYWEGVRSCNMGEFKVSYHVIWIYFGC